MDEISPPPRVCLAISSYRHDEEIAQLLGQAARLAPDLFFRVLVVDSLGTGKIPELARERGWPWLEYRNSATNLGSAGNLAKRLEVAAELGADWAYALNHDGEIHEETIRALIRAATKEATLGAAYPLRRLQNRDDCFDLTGRARFSMSGITTKIRPTAEEVEVYWASSNGALYSMNPVRQGLRPWADLWMGFEDLAYGWLLAVNGFRQVIVTDAEFCDNYEFRRVSFLGLSLTVSDKPSWYSYYYGRNLLTIIRRIRVNPPTAWAIYFRIVIEFCLTVLFRDQKGRRLRYLATGTLDGLKGRLGMQPPPRPTPRKT